MYKITNLTPTTRKQPLYVLSDDEIIGWLKRFQFDPDFRDQYGCQAVPLACFCSFAGVSRWSVYRFIRGDRAMSERMRERLSEAIAAVRSGLRWRRLGDHSYVMNDGSYQNFPKYERLEKRA